MKNFTEKLADYAALVVAVGVNVQENQTVVINGSIDNASFVRLLAKAAYERGAKEVIVDWKDDDLTKMKFELAKDEAFDQYSSHLAKWREELAAENACFISIASSDPELLKGVDQDRMSRMMKATMKELAPFRKFIMNSTVAWNVISVPSAGWAKKVFPNVSEDQAIEQLWASIFSIVRADQDDPVAAWEEHLNMLKQKKDYLNEERFKSLRFSSQTADFTVDLPANHNWQGGGKENAKGTYFVANMPTEEVHTMPHRLGVNGWVTSTKPLNYQGKLIEEFTLTFKDGKIVAYEAKEGYDALDALINTDEGSAYLGEVALVPHHSPISDTGIIFYNTLFDENASCHLAIGNAYPKSMIGGENLTEEALKEAGANISMTHVDFMIGSADLTVTGIKEDGSEIPLFKEGNWAF